jgi:cytochrome c6
MLSDLQMRPCLIHHQQEGEFHMLKLRVCYATASLLIFAGSALSLAQTGADTYKAKCQMCHGATGLGDTPAGKAMNAHPFNSADVLKESDADLIAVIKNGKNKMPAFAGKLTDAQINDVVAFIHTLSK